VHRDIKPHNVLIDQDGRVRVTDFGIARAGASDMTETGSIMGTAQYLSPEQAQGRPVDERADLYAIGIVLYELVTGQVPFDADSPVTVALKQVNEMPVPPSQLAAAVPPALEQVVLKAMEKLPENRFQTADEFIAALDRARAAPQEVIAAPPPVEEILEEEDRNRWWLWLLILLALAAIAVGLWLTLRPEQLTVPDVIGRESNTAAQILNNRGFDVQEEARVDEDAPRGQVIAQDPRPDTTAPEGSTVTIFVSSGPGEAAVPTVDGLPQEEAEQQLTEAGFRVDAEREFSDQVRSGRVIATQPPGGTVIERGTTVTLQVSRGPEQAEVPDVVGQTEDNARSALESANLRVGEVTEEESDEEAGTVIDQSPAAGEEVDRDSAVDLTVAAPTPVPDVVDMTEDEAVAALEEAGFDVRVRDQETAVPEEDGVVLEQNPPADEERSQGSRVTIIVGRLAEATPTPTPTPTVVP
jgi:serine/threonine-protein kinase